MTKYVTKARSPSGEKLTQSVCIRLSDEHFAHLQSLSWEHRLLVPQVIRAMIENDMQKRGVSHEQN